MPYKGTLTGIRTLAEEKSGCAVCGSLGVPALAYVPNESPSSRGRTVHRYCLPCIGRAVEEATGWKVMRAWSQWLASSLQAQEYRVNKSGPVAPQVKE